MMLTAAAAAFLLSCAPNVSAETMAGLVEHESGWHQYAIGDNTARRSYFPTTYWDAVELALSLRSHGHNVDAGLAQINDSNWRSYGLDEYSVFDPCRNVRVGGTILGRAYASAVRSFSSPQVALVHALSAYNSGGFYASLGYANAVIQDARNVRFLQTTPISTAVANIPPPVAVAGLAVRRALPARTALAARQPGPVVLRTVAHRTESTTQAGRVLTWALPARSAQERK
jgi:type IV secretion system protein VirB1